MSEEQIKDMILKQCLELTTNNDFRPPISAYDGIDIDDVVRTCKQLQDKKTYLDLVKENQELKKENEQLQQENKILRENAVADYETTMSELQELKKQVEEYKDNYNCLLKQKEQFEYIMSKQVDYQGQQKEFIEWLEDEIKELQKIKETELDYDFLNDVTTQLLDYKEILQKYKSIIGGKG